MVGLPVVEFGEFGGEFVGEAGVTEKAQAGVLEGACGAAAGGGNAGHPVGEGDHAFGDRAAVGFVAVQGAGGESPAQGVAVLDAGVLTWPPAWLCRRAASLARKSRPAQPCAGPAIPPNAQVRHARPRKERFPQHQGLDAS